MAPAPESFPPAEISIERLAIAVDRLTEHVRVLTDLVQATHEELRWIAQNGVPHQTLTVRMDLTSSALPPASDDGPWQGPVTHVEDPGGKPVTERALEEACEWLLEEYGTLAQEQLNLLVGAQNEWKREILAAINKNLLVTTPTTARPAKPAADVVLAPVATRPSASSSPSLAVSPVVHKPRHFSFEDEASPVNTQNASSPPLTPVISGLPPPAALSALPPLTQFEIGDAVEFKLDERTVWGEIIALRNAANTATVQLIPSTEEVTVAQNQLLPERASERCGCIALGPSLPPVFGVREIGLEAASATGPVTLAT
ncbi:MAG: hypothetical protein Q8K78_13890, partial [Planctomycetaceae bacterium]|nr:hypothetical protein [Planctomycetaceae bacterium]